MDKLEAEVLTTHIQACEERIEIINNFLHQCDNKYRVAQVPKEVVTTKKLMLLLLNDLWERKNLLKTALGILS